MTNNKDKYKSVEFKAPAKINIGLRILSKRKDGYHNLETIFYPVNIFDTLKLKIIGNSSGNQIKIKTIPQTPIQLKDNICYKAITQFIEKFKVKGYYHIELTIRKRIPIGAGLGGGSSDAASVIKALYKILKIKNQERKLEELALTLGSDVPFFLVNKPALAKSRGEKIKVLDKFEIKNDLLIVNPGINVSTKWAFDEIDNLRKSEIRNPKSEKKHLRILVNKWSLKSPINTPLYLENDFEEVVFKKYPLIKTIKEKMMEYGSIIRIDEWERVECIRNF